MRQLPQDPMFGLCYVMSEAAYHMFAKDHGFSPRVLRYRKGKTHWWLENKAGKVLDLTASQFDGPFPYHKGKGCGFLTKAPSRRAKAIIDLLEG